MAILLGIMRTMARSLQGTRAYDFEAVDRGKRLNFVGAMRLEKVIARKIPKWRIVQGICERRLIA